MAYAARREEAYRDRAFCRRAILGAERADQIECRSGLAEQSSGRRAQVEGGSIGDDTTGLRRSAATGGGEAPSHSGAALT